MKVLAIGDNAQNFAREIFPDAEVNTSTIQPGKKRTDYDSVMAYMCLQNVPYRDVTNTVKAWVDTLKQGGELTIMVPSMEWAAIQVLSKDRSPALLAHLFGVDNKSMSGFTMMDLRAVCSTAGVAITHAATGEYSIGENVCELHTVRGVKK